MSDDRPDRPRHRRRRTAGDAARLRRSPHEASDRRRTLWGDALYRLRRNKLALVALVWHRSSSSLAAVTADLWVPQLFGDPTHYRHARPRRRTGLQPPSVEHPMGTDDLGRDIFGRVDLRRARLARRSASLAVGHLGGHRAAARARSRASTAASSTRPIMRVADIFLAFPVHPVRDPAALGAARSDRGASCPVDLTIGLLGWPSIARVFRSSILSVKENDYVDAGRALGASDCAPHVPAHHAERDRADRRVRHDVDRRRDPHRGGAVLPRPGHPSAAHLLGSHDRGRARLPRRRNPGLVFWPGLAILRPCSRSRCSATAFVTRST